MAAFENEFLTRLSLDYLTPYHRVISSEIVVKNSKSIGNENMNIYVFVCLMVKHVT